MLLVYKGPLSATSGNNWLNFYNLLFVQPQRWIAPSSDAGRSRWSRQFGRPAQRV